MFQKNKIFSFHSIKLHKSLMACEKQLISFTLKNTGDYAEKYTFAFDPNIASIAKYSSVSENLAMLDAGQEKEIEFSYSFLAMLQQEIIMGCSRQKQV